MTTSIESIDSTTSRVLVGGAESFRFTSAGAKFLTGMDLNQTWQNLLASRASGVTYTNSTGKPIKVRVSFSGSAGGCTALITVGIVTGLIDTSGTGVRGGTEFEVPTGGTYSVTLSSGTPSFAYWSELR